MANVTEMPPPETAGAVETPFDSPPEQATPAPDLPTNGKNKGGRPPKAAAKLKPEGKAPTFFKRVAEVPEEDWGTRAFMYLYIDEPVCIAKTWGETRYAKKFHKPILDLEPLKELYGSFKGWLSLNIRKTGKDATDQIDRFEFEIFDPVTPPKVPRKAWANDDRNRRWEALMPAEKPTPTESAGTMLDAMRMYKEIRSDVKEELPEPVAPTDQTKSTLETMKIAKELFAQPAVSPTVVKDPLEIATALATTFMQMKADNPMVDFLNKQMDRQHQEMMEMRKELAEARKAPAESPKSFFDQLMEFAGDETKLDRIKKVASVFGFGIDSGGGRASRTTALDVARELANSPFGANIGQALGMIVQHFATPTPVNGAAPQVLNAVPPNPAGSTTATHETDQQRIQRIAGAITRPMIDEFFDKGEEGNVFAERIWDMWPNDLVFLRGLGTDTIVNLYRQHNQMLWNHITVTNGNREPQFRTFIADFLAWRSEQETAPPPADNTESDGFTDGGKVQ